MKNQRARYTLCAVLSVLATLSIQQMFSGVPSANARGTGPAALGGPPIPCPGDNNGDFVVNAADLSVLLANFGTVCAPDADLDGVAVRQLPVGEEPREGAPAHELGDEVHGVVVVPGLEEGDDPVVGQTGGGERLPLRARPGALPLDRDPLDRDGAVELLVVGQPHGPEPTRADPAHQAVAVQHGGPLVARAGARRRDPGFRGG